MAKVITTELQHSGASGANITLDSSKNVTAENNLTVDGTLTVTGTTTLNGTVVGDNAGAGKARNLIINGACLVAQRATSSTSHGYSTVDRLKPYETGTDCGTKTWSQSDVAAGNDCYNAGFRKAFKVTTAQAGNTGTASDMFKHWATRIEAQDIAGSGWKYTDPNSKLALSFWIKASTADNFQVQLQTHDGTNKKFNFVAPATTSWTKITKIIPGHADLQFDNNNDQWLSIGLYLAVGADFAGSVTQETWVANTVAFLNSSQINTWIAAGAGNVETTGWQLEVGDAVTDYEHRSYGDELLRCQRYYENIYLSSYSACGQAYHVSNALATGWFRVEKRANPSMTFPAVGQGSGEITFTTASASYPSTHGSIAVNDVSKHKFNYSGSGFTNCFGVGDAALLHCNGTGTVKANAEL